MAKQQKEKDNTTIPPKTRQEIADKFSICVKTLNRWLNRQQIEVPKRALIHPTLYELIVARWSQLPTGSETIDNPHRLDVN